jgi:hypothetical protein
MVAKVGGVRLKEVIADEIDTLIRRAGRQWQAGVCIYSVACKF